jgi:Mrp family chromosome partitioning ATPase
LIIQEWLRPVEQLLLSGSAHGRVMGIASADPGSGVSSLARMCAEVLARSGRNTVLVDLSRPVEETRVEPDWVPGGKRALQAVQHAPSGFDLLPAAARSETRFLFNNVELLRQSLNEELGRYQSVIVDLPPILSSRTDLLNAVAGAVACDSCVLVCVSRQLTRARLASAARLLTAAGAKVAGTVMNDVLNPSLEMELARHAQFLGGFFPRLARILAPRPEDGRAMPLSGH